MGDDPAGNCVTLPWVHVFKENGKFLGFTFSFFSFERGLNFIFYIFLIVIVFLIFYFILFFAFFIFFIFLLYFFILFSFHLLSYFLSANVIIAINFTFL